MAEVTKLIAPRSGKQNLDRSKQASSLGNHWSPRDTWLRQGVLFCCLLGLLAGCQFKSPLNTGNPNLRLGNPSGATPTLSTPNNYLIERLQYVLSYNRDKGIPNWVSWQLNADWLGKLPRGTFTPDESLPAGWYRVVPQDYTSSGFDRGHLVPAADRNRTPEDSAAVFLMTNILPQAPENNRGPWEQLERHCRDLAEKGHELYIIAGGAGIGGQGSRRRQTTLQHGKIAVPSVTWKIVVDLKQSKQGIKGINMKTHVIAVIIPNQNNIGSKNWHEFSTSVRAIESLTGYNFLSEVPADIKANLESKVDEK